MGIIQSCSHVSTTLWLHHLHANEIPAEKARWELHKNVAYCFVLILETASYGAAAIRPLTSHHTNHPNKMSKTCWALREK